MYLGMLSEDFFVYNGGIHMFNFFSKKIDKNLYAPVSGYCVGIENVNDPVFSSKMMGDGFAIKPQENVISAPCDGIITMIFDTKHAFGIKTNDGKEILVHIGVDTVNLKGKGFKAMKATNDKVKVGDPVIKVDLATINETHDSTVMVVITNNGYTPSERKLDQNVESKALIMSFE